MIKTYIFEPIRVLFSTTDTYCISYILKLIFYFFLVKTHIKTQRHAQGVNFSFHSFFFIQYIGACDQARGMENTLGFLSHIGVGTE